MDYPNDFNIKSFPAGKTIALSRSVSIWISIVFFLIIAMCGFILMVRHYRVNYPFLISVDPFTEEWSVVTYPGKDENEKLHQYQIVQEKLVRDFVTNWFSISTDPTINEKRWRDCDVADCDTPEQFSPDNIDCAISCKSNESVFSEFANNVFPDYQNYATSGGKWTVGPMLITPFTVNQISGTWQVVVSVQPSMAQSFDALAFITIEQDKNKYPATLGYHITNFNSYRIEK